MLEVILARCRPWWHLRIPQGVLTFDVVGAVAEMQSEDVVDGAVGVQRVGALVVAHEAILPPEDQDGPVDELQQELLVLS